MVMLLESQEFGHKLNCWTNRKFELMLVLGEKLWGLWSYYNSSWGENECIKLHCKSSNTCWDILLVKMSSCVWRKPQAKSLRFIWESRMVAENFHPIIVDSQSGPNPTNWLTAQCICRAMPQAWLKIITHTSENSLSESSSICRGLSV